jgi:RPA family protein
MADGESARRQVAFKARVADIVNNRYVKEDGWLPNYIAVGDLKISRANLLGVIISKELQEADVVSQNFILDDGSGRIALKFFEPAKPLDVGDIVTVIGRQREFGTDRYIVPEIIRKITDSRWVEVRKLELASMKHLQKRAEESRPEARESPAKGEYLSVETEDLVEDANPMSEVLDIIRQLDKGDGVGFEDISAKSGKDDVEGMISRLLEHGDIFEIRPGRYKVLE